MRHLKKMPQSGKVLSEEAIQVMRRCDWPGNVRELANALEYEMILSDGETIRPGDLPASISMGPAGSRTASNVATTWTGAKTLREIEMEGRLSVLEKHNGDKPKAAAELGIALKTLYNKLNQYRTHKAAG